MMTEPTVKYKLAVTAGYKFNIAKIGNQAYDPESYFNKSNFPDIEITRPNTETNLESIHNDFLVTVNGYILPTVYDNRKLYIKNGTVGILKTTYQNIGMLSFRDLGGSLIKTPITPDMVTGDSPISMYEKSIITFDRPIGSCFLVLAGYMVFEQEEFFYRLSDRSFAIRLDRLNYVARLYELARYRNIFEEIAVDTSPVNPSVIDAEDVTSDETIRKFLTLFNTFLVEVPNATLRTRPIYLEHSNVPGDFRTQLHPDMPFIGGYGKICEYSYNKSSPTKYTVIVNDAYFNKHLFSRMSTSDIKLYNSARIVGASYELSQGFFLEIKKN